MPEDLSAIFPAGVRIDSVSSLVRDLADASLSWLTSWRGFVMAYGGHVAAVGLTVYNDQPAIVIVITDPDSYAAARQILVAMGKG
jgi:hypothetical protein